MRHDPTKRGQAKVATVQCFCEHADTVATCLEGISWSRELAASHADNDNRLDTEQEDPPRTQGKPIR